jgi:hypothetical protein
LLAAVSSVVPMSADDRILVNPVTREIWCSLWPGKEIITRLDIQEREPHPVLVLNGETWYVEVTAQGLRRLTKEMPESIRRERSAGERIEDALHVHREEIDRIVAQWGRPKFPVSSNTLRTLETRRYQVRRFLENYLLANQEFPRGEHAIDDSFTVNFDRFQT